MLVKRLIYSDPDSGLAHYFEASNLANFLGVEIFKSGTWTDNSGKTHTWTNGDLDKIVSSYRETKDTVHAPLKLGHNDKQKLLGDDAYAIGWIENLRRVGKTLVGDFMKVPEAIAKLIQEGAYRGRSAEISREFEIDDKKYPLMLTGVALLGGRLPAVSGLKDILSLYEREDIEYAGNAELIYFESEGDDEELATFLEDFSSRLEGRIKNQRGAPHVRALVSALKNSISTIKKGTSNNEMDKDKIIKLLGLKDDATEAEIEEALKSKHSKDDDKTPDKSEHSKNDDKNGDESKAELSKANERILVLEQQAAVGEASGIVDKAIKDGKLLPTQREFALSMAVKDKEQFSKFVESQPKVIDFSEHGTSNDGDASDFTKYEPNKSEVEVATQMGHWSGDFRKKMMREKAAHDGKEIPDSFFEKKS